MKLLATIGLSVLLCAGIYVAVALFLIGGTLLVEKIWTGEHVLEFLAMVEPFYSVLRFPAVFAVVAFSAWYTGLIKLSSG